ncbi:MAG: DUF4810 domain-containing protein [Bacteroidia bacterium]|nr:DUF4810 domain-containing protein [Bacteroidia bacterium]
MRKVIFIIAVLLASCSSQKPLYSWGKYEITSYNYLNNSDEKSTKAIIKAYQKIISSQKGTRKMVPPGVYADYGFVLLQANKTQEGKAMLLKEIALYPESEIFMNRILKIINK